jgi:hypothetical protein
MDETITVYYINDDGMFDTVEFDHLPVTIIRPSYFIAEPVAAFSDHFSLGAPPCQIVQDRYNRFKMLSPTIGVYYKEGKKLV